jgi:uncharacterized protein (TIGR03663 family)
MAETRAVEVFGSFLCPPEAEKYLTRGTGWRHMPADDAASSATVRDPVVLAVAALAALALLARLVGLGGRPFHWDEARVGYWTLRYLDTGQFSYRPVAGGPFLYVTTRPVLAALGATDATARLVVAALGGLLPLSALLFRERFDDGETVALAGVLAVSPVLLYYSRFLRGDVPLAAFSIVAAGAFVRAYDGDRRFLYLGALAGALALTTSAFAAGYLLCWLGAGLILFDHRRLLGDGTSVGAGIRDGLDRADEWATLGARIFLLVVAVLVFFYAPRGGAVGLWQPTTWPAILERSLFESGERFYGVWVAARAREGAHPLVPFVVESVSLLASVALPTTLLALGAFLRDRYSTGGPRSVVAFFAYWGFLGLLVFPVITEVAAPWVLVHVLAPLSIPAAVGVAGLVRYGVRSAERNSAGRVVAAALVLLALSGQAGAVAASDVFGPSAPENRLAQYGQPADDLGGFAADVRRHATADDAVDVLYYGERFYVADESSLDRPPVPDQFSERLPLAWYVERVGATTDSALSLDDYADEDLPPVVVADVSHRNTLSDRLSDYERSEYELALWNRNVVVFVRSD